MMMTRLTLALLICLPTTAKADVMLHFDEGAPKDTFTITNTGGCDIGPATLVIDMKDSAGGLYFDTTDQGAGVEVFQPFETTEGAELVSAAAPVGDGDTMLSLELFGLGKGKSVAFTIDVDDTLRHGALGQTQVAGGEVAGTTAVLIHGSSETMGVFDTTKRARIRVAACTS